MHLHSNEKFTAYIVPSRPSWIKFADYNKSFISLKYYISLNHWFNFLIYQTSLQHLNSNPSATYTFPISPLRDSLPFTAYDNWYFFILDFGGHRLIEVHRSRSHIHPGHHTPTTYEPRPNHDNRLCWFQNVTILNHCISEYIRYSTQVKSCVRSSTNSINNVTTCIIRYFFPMSTWGTVLFCIVR